MSGTATPGQGQTATPPAGAQAQAQGSPWEKDLAFIEDESIRSQVSDYLGQKVQPYVTNLEQKAKPAVEFYEDFQADPGSVTLDVIEELYGEGVAKNFAEIVTAEFGDDSPNEVTNTEQQQPASQPNEDPRLKRMLDSWEQSENEKEWKTALADLQEQHQDVEIDDLLFRPFAAMTDGDLDQALIGYRQFLSTAKEKFVAAEDGDENEVQPPPALGAQGGGTPHPVEPTGQTLGEAIEGWVGDLRAQGQPVAPPNPNA